MEKIIVIGTGFIGEYMGEGFRRLFGKDLQGKVFGIKGSANGAEQRSEQLGYTVSAGDALNVISREKPSIILLSPPPEKVLQIAQESLKPYYDYCRKEKYKLPDLYTFVPNPGADALYEILGGGFNCAKILPNIFSDCCGIDITPIGISYISPASQKAWDAERLEILKRIMSPYGDTAVLTDSDALVLLSGKITSHVCCEVCYTIKAACDTKGADVTVNQLGNALRLTVSRLCPDLPAIMPSDDEAIPKPLRAFISDFAAAWYRGLRNFTLSMPLSVSQAQAEIIDRHSFALNIFPIAFESRSQLEQDTKNAATKGGVLERGIEYFYENTEKPLMEQAEKVLCGTAAPKEFFLWAEKQSEALSKSAYERCMNLIKSKK